MISHKHKCIFIHIPKCGGSSVESVLWPASRTESDLWMGFVSRYCNKYQTGGLQHLFAQQVRQEVGEAYFDRYFKFSFVRNPWDKAVSQFEYMKRRPDLREYIDLPDGASFKLYLSRIAKKIHVQWDMQSKFVFDDDGGCMVDYLGKFESFSDDFAVVAEKIGLAGISLPHVNKGERRALSHYYDEEAIGMIGDLYAEDINNFAYRYPG